MYLQVPKRLGGLSATSGGWQQIRTGLQSSELQDVSLSHSCKTLSRQLRLLRINKTSGGGFTGTPRCTTHCSTTKQCLVPQAPRQTKQFWMHLSISSSQFPTNISFLLWHTLLLTQNPVRNVFRSKNTNMDWISNYSHLRFIFLIPWKLSRHQSKLVSLSRKFNFQPMQDPC